MWVFTQTQPKSSRAAIRDAVPCCVVQTDEARPYTRVVGKPHRLVLVGEVLHGEHRPEHLGADQFVVLLQVGDHRRLVEEPVSLESPSAGGQPGVGGCPLHEPGDVAELARVVDRAVEDVLVVRVPAGAGDRGRLGPTRPRTRRRRPACTSTRVAAVQSWPPLNRPATEMPSIAAARSTSSKTTTGALPPSSRWATFRSAAAGGRDGHAGAGRAGDRDHLRDWVRGQRGTGVAVAADEVASPRREDVLHLLDHPYRRGRASCRTA